MRIIFIFILTLNSIANVSANNEIIATNNINEGNSSAEKANNGESNNQGFLKGVKYGLSYPFVFWGAEGFEKVPLNEMAGDFGFGYFIGLLLLLGLVVFIFALKKKLDI